MDIQNIIRAIDSQNYYITNHADEEAQVGRLDFEEIFYSVRNGEIIKDYPLRSTIPKLPDIRNKRRWRTNP